MNVTEARAKIEAVVKKACPGISLLKGQWESAPKYPFCVVLYNGLKFYEDSGETYGDLGFAIVFIKDVEIITYDNGETEKDYDTAASFTGDLAVKFVNALKSSKLEAEVEGDAPPLRFEENSIDVAGTEINLIVQSE